MKYFTKEWYADTILADMCFQIKKTSKAEKFNEKFYLSLYNAQKKWFVKSEKFLAKHNKTTFDQSSSEAAFEANHRENIEYVKANLPQSILDRVADIRVLALGSASYEITDAIVRYCGQVNRRCQAVSDSYDEELERLADSIGWTKINLLNKIANSAIEIAELDEKGNFVFATTAEYTGVPCRVDLIDAKVIRCDEGLVGAATAHFELTKGENSVLLFSALCQKLDGSLVELSVEAADLEVL